MITKVLYSKNIAATINYVMNPKKLAEVSLSRGIGSLFDVGRIIRDFERQASLHPSLQVKVVHIPTSFHVNDLPILNAHSNEILQDWLDCMESKGYHFDQYFYGEHHDKDHKNPHWHFVGNIVLDDGSRANLAYIGKAAKEASIYITEKWGLTSAMHLRNEIAKEQDAVLGDYLHAEYITADGVHIKEYGSENIDVNDITDGNPSPFDVDFGSLDVVGICQAILFPDTAPSISSGGGGGNDEDEDKKKKKKCRSNNSSLRR